MKKYFSRLWDCLGRFRTAQFRAMAVLLALMQLTVPVASAFGDSLERHDSAGYWVGQHETELTQYWGLPDGRVSFPDGSSLITYQPGRTIGGPGFKMERAKYLKDQVEFRVNADGLVLQYAIDAVSSSPDSYHPWLIFVAGLAAGVVLTLAALAIALSTITPATY